MVGDKEAEDIRVNWLAGVPIAKLLRYSGASIVSMAIGLLALGVGIDVFHFSPTVANVFAIAVCTGPSFELNRRWVWNVRGRAGAGEIVPFCLLAAAGLVLSTLAVRYAGSHSVSFANPWRTFAVDGANLAAYAQLWVIRYFVLDRFLFADKTGEPQGVVGHLPLTVSVAAGSSAATDWSANSGRSTLNTAPPPGQGRRGDRSAMGSRDRSGDRESEPAHLLVLVRDGSAR